MGMAGRIVAQGVRAERLSSPQQFAEAVAAHLDTCARAGLPLPARADFIALVEATFYASLHEEEARRLEANVAWQPVAHDCTSVVTIAPMLPLTPRTLAKLAPATHREASSIAVRRQGNELVVWALLEHGRAQPCTLRVLGPGILRVDYDGSARALYARGEMFLLNASVKSPAQLLTRTFAQWRAAADASTGIAERAAIVTRLAARALDHGHGGMILIVPAEVATPVGVRVHYEIGDGALLLASRHAIDLVARLTAIDNALLIDTDLRLRGFGVQVLEGAAPQMQFEHADPYSDEVHVDDLSTFKGTRHPAGVVFCMRQECEAAAIIASQDARLSLAMKNAHGVEVIGSYERAFGWS